MAALSRSHDAVLDGFPWNVHAMIYWHPKGWSASLAFIPTRPLRPADRLRFDRSGLLQNLRRRLARLGYRGSWQSWDRPSDLGGSFNRKLSSLPKVRREIRALNDFLESL